jgi:hypothetical protein
MKRLQHLSPHSALTVPSPLAGEGQGEGYPTTCSLDFASRNKRLFRTPFAEPPLSPALPRKGGGSRLSTQLQRSTHRTQPLRGTA